MQLSDYQRYSFRANIETKLTERLRVGVSSTVSSDLQNVMANGPYTNALQFSPLVQPYDADGNFIAYPNPREGLLTSPLLQYQPGQFTNERKKYRVFANIFAEYTFMEGLTYRLNFGPDFSTSRQGEYKWYLGRQCQYRRGNQPAKLCLYPGKHPVVQPEVWRSIRSM